MTWPDIVIGGIVAFAALKGYKRGFVSELAGAIAIIVALFTGFRYNGAIDAAVGSVVHVGPGSAHVIGMVLAALAGYAIVAVLAAILTRVAKLPFLGFGNAVVGAAIGVLKSAVFLWALLYVALFFPLSHDLRDDLHHSRLVALLVAPDRRIDDAISATLPWFVRPFASHLFAGHRW